MAKEMKRLIVHVYGHEFEVNKKKEKEHLYLLAAVAMAVTSTAFPMPAAAAPEELMNSTFEEGYGAWKGVGSTIEITSDYAHGGEKSLYVSGRTASWGALRGFTPAHLREGGYTMSDVSEWLTGDRYFMRDNGITEEDLSNVAGENVGCLPLLMIPSIMP